MAQFQGKGGSIQFNSQAVAEVQSWSIDSEQDELDTTAMGADWRTFLGGLAAWTGEIELNLDYGDTNGQKVIIDKLLAATPVGTTTPVQFRVTATKYVGGNALVRRINFRGNRDNLFTFVVSLRGSGALTPTWS